MTPATVPAAPCDLPGGLTLRTAEPGDQEQIEALLVERGEAEDGLDHRLVVQDEDAGWQSCAVVVDGERVVSTATLLDESLRVGTVQLAAGQVELVATDKDYEGRGLVRALMGWAHERSAARGHIVQVMIGIPYFYRRFGYEYAIDIATAPALRKTPAATGNGRLRLATPQDVPAMAALQESAQRVADVAMPHPTARWRWLLAREGSTVWACERDDEVVATGRTTMMDDGGVLLAEAAAVDESAARDLVVGAAAIAEGHPVRVAQRPGTTVHAVARGLAEDDDPVAEQYYIRIPDPAELLDRLRPVFSQRMQHAGLDRAGRELVLSLYSSHHRMAVTDEGLGPVTSGGPMQSPGAAGGAGCAPDQLAALLFGPLGMHGLSRRRPDVYPGRDPEWFDAVFPPLRADLLTYYLPY